MKTVTRIALLQILIGLSGTGIWIAIEGWSAGPPAACGGIIAALLTLYAGLKTFGVHSDDPNVMMTNFYRAHMRKLLLSVVLFAVAVKLFGTHFAPLITTFLVCLSAYWFALLWDS